MMMTSINELAVDSYSYLTIEFCAGCDARFASFVPVNPGDHYHQVVATCLCDKCTEKSNQGLIEINIFSDLNEVDSHRKRNGLSPFKKAYEQFQLDDFNSYLKAEGKLIKYYENKIGLGTLSEKLLMWMIEEIDEAAIIDSGASIEQLEQQLNYLLNGPEEVEHSLDTGMDYYDPHRDLMIQRYKELGSSYFS